MFNALHYSMLMDSERNSAFYKGIETLIKPGDIVIDAGSGTGLLSMMAAKLGASKVYAIEGDKETALLSKEIIKDNGFEKIIEVVNCDIRDFKPGEMVDLIISETVGNFLLNERIIPLRNHLSKFLKDKTKFIPCDMKLYLRPCFSHEFEIKKDNLDEVEEFSYRSMKDFIKNSMFSMKLEEYNFFNKEYLEMDFNLLEEESFPKEKKKEMKFSAPERINGIGAYFDIGIAENIVLSNSPEFPLSHWPQFFMPLGEIVNTEKIKLEIKISNPSYQGFNWIVTTDDNLFSGSTALSCLSEK